MIYWWPELPDLRTLIWNKQVCERSEEEAEIWSAESLKEIDR